VQRVLGDVLDLLHASTDETSKGLSHSTHSAGT
jgi:hypothetical protein